MCVGMRSEESWNDAPNLQEARDRMIRDVVIINTPQLLLSVLYFIYNSIFTSMLSGHEWNRFATRRKALRVIRPSWPNADILAPTPVVLQHAAHHHRRSASLAGR